LPTGETRVGDVVGVGVEVGAVDGGEDVGVGVVVARMLVQVYL